MNIRTARLMAFFSLFFITAHCNYDDFTREHFEIIYQSENANFIRSDGFSGTQRMALSSLYDNGNLIRIMQRYHDLSEKENNRDHKARKILDNLLKAGSIDLSYTALNESIKKTCSYYLGILQNCVKNNNHNLERLSEKKFVNGLCHSLLVDEFGNTGLMLVAQIGNKKVFKYFLRAYVNQNCPLDAKNSNGQTIYDLVGQSVITKILNNEKDCRLM